jgi:hypothetical protein
MSLDPVRSAEGEQSVSMWRGSPTGLEPATFSSRRPTLGRSVQWQNKRKVLSFPDVYMTLYQSLNAMPFCSGCVH